jgi:ABC-2 type transport system permease protein
VSATSAPRTGVIHDIGYQRYEGPRLGRGYATRSLFIHSVRSGYGLGRSAWAKVLPIGLLGLACIASLILVVINTQLPEPVLDYVGIASTFTYAATVFVAVVAPELVSVDLRTNLLQLYLARPIRRSDYALAKLAALTTATFLLYAVPMLIMFAGMAFSTDDGITGVLHEFGGLCLGLLAAAIHAALLSAIGLPLASLSGRRVFASGIVIAVFLLTAPVSAALQVMGGSPLGELAGMINPATLVAGVDQWLFGSDLQLALIGGFGAVYGVVTVVLIALGTACAVWRYRKVKS